MFFVVFPFANSLLDWGSLTVTRLMMRWWVAAKGSAVATFTLYGVGILFDLAIAVVCVWALSALFSAGVAGFNALIAWRVEDAGPETVEWMTQMRAFRDEPLGDGLMVTLMLFSTLLPTLFHLAAGTAALFRLPHLGRDTVLRVLAAGEPDMTNRVGLGFLIAVQWLVPIALWVFIGLLFLRFFLPWSCLTPLLPTAWVPTGADGFLIPWLAYHAAETTWTLLGGGGP